MFNKTITIIKFVIFLTLIFIFYQFEAKAERTKLTIAGDYWCPYNCMPDSENEGFLVDLTKRALYIYGVDIEYKMMPWHEALQKVSKGEIDGIIAVTDVDASNLITTDVPSEYSQTEAFVRAGDKWVYDGLSSLRGKKLGVIMDYNLDEDIKNFVGINYAKDPSRFVIEDGKNSDADSVNNLVKKKNDIYVEDVRVMNYYIKTHDLSSYIKSAGVITKEKLPLYIAFNKNIPKIQDYIGFLEEGIASLKATGEYKYLRQKYQMDSLGK